MNLLGSTNFEIKVTHPLESTEIGTHSVCNAKEKLVIMSHKLVRFWSDQSGIARMGGGRNGKY